MTIRAYRIRVPVLVEDVNNPNALAVHDRLNVIVEAHSQLEAVRKLESAIVERMPVGFTFMTITETLPMHVYTRIHFLEPNDGEGERVHRHVDGRYDGINRQTGSLRFSPLMNVSTENAHGTVIMPTIEIPFDDVRDHRVIQVVRTPVEGVAADPLRMDVHVTGHFAYTDHSEGGVELHVPERYVRSV